MEAARLSMAASIGHCAPAVSGSATPIEVQAIEYRKKNAP
jgi:hypothetical protein